MRFHVVIPGQPISWDAAYRSGRVAIRRRGKPVLNDDLTPRTIIRPIKTDEAARWQEQIAMLVRAAKPSRWKPNGQIRILIDLHLARNIDADNVTKLLLDAVATGIGYDDSNFLHCIRSKEAGLHPRDARVVLTIDDDPSHPL